MTTSFQTPTEPITFREAQDARRSNERAYETTVNIQDLPSQHVAYEATPTAVQATATDMNVIGDWLFVMGGTITTVDLPSGQTVWTLHTATWTDSEEFQVVPVHVSVVQLTGAPVMHEIAAAVRA